MPRRRSPYAGRPKSRLITARRYPEEWAWWRASGWVMTVEGGAPGYAHLNSYKASPTVTVWGATAEPADTASPAAVRRFLATALYFHLHPRKAHKAFELTGAVCSEAELVAFVRQQRRKVAKPTT